jgi:glycosyltransferase involved in cell wall biosynthesis
MEVDKPKKIDVAVIICTRNRASKLASLLDLASNLVFKV